MTVLSGALVVAAGCNAIFGFEAGQIGAAGGGGAVGAQGGSGAVGGGPECASPEDCPGLDTACEVRACTDRRCGFTRLAAGTPCADDGGVVCDGDGTCVECLGDAQCASGRCVLNQCVPDHCLDGEPSGDETDSDCGGSCVPCENGQGCNDGGDCQSGYCNATQRCEACVTHSQCSATDYCDDGVCTAKQADGGSCIIPEACQSGYCADNVCCNQACSGPCLSCLSPIPGFCSGATCSCDVQYGTESAYLECTPNPPSACEFYTAQPALTTCAEICARNGGECLDGWDHDGGASCVHGVHGGCDTLHLDQICQCSRGCGAGPRCPPGQTCTGGSCS